MVTDLHLHHPRAVLQPQPLSASAAAIWVRRDHPGASDRVCAAFAEASGGNPFYLRELLAGTGAGELEADSFAGPGDATPESIRSSVAARIERGGADARALSEAICVFGSAGTLHDASRLASLEASEAAAAADALLELEILAAVDPPSFVHPVVAAAVRDAIPPARRGLAHREAARLLDERGADDEAVASQLLEAASGSGEWAIAALERAGARAIERGSPATATRYLSRALDEAPEPPRRGAILAALGLAEAAAGEDGGAARIEEAVALIIEPIERASSLFELAMVYVHQGRYPRSAAAAARGLEELGSLTDPLAESLAVARDNSTVWVDLTDAAATLERAELAISRADPAAPAGRSALANAAVALAFTDSTCKRIGEVARCAIDGREPTADPFDSHAFPVAAYALVVAGDPEAAEEAMAGAVEAAQARGSVLELAAAVHARSVARLELGRVADAVTDAEGAVEAGRWGWGATLPFAHSRLVLGYIEQGRLDEAERALELPGGEARWAVNATYGTWLLARAELMLATGEATQARDQLDLCGRLADLVHAFNPGVIAWRGAAARAFLALGARERAHQLAAEEVALARRFGCRGPLGAALRVEALAGDSDPIASLRESVSVLEKSQSRLELARSQVELGAALRRSGSIREAKEMLRGGLDLAHRCGATTLAARAREELRVAGARPRRDALSGVEALTPSERRVAALAAVGRSNPEIARELMVTRRTVEMHLSAVYTKLEIASRDELDPTLAAR
jgi:DNA-binding CsgD family transcriptional regulator